GAARDRRGDVRTAVAGDVLDGVDALVAGLVRQPRRAGAVADGVEPLHVGLAVGVGPDVTAVHLDAQRLKPDAVGVGGDADGRDAGLGRQRLGLAAGLRVDGDAGLRGRHAGDLRARAELQAALLEGLAGGPGDLLVLDRQDPVHGL